eukprot:jgi/Chrzof1/6025/Cz17g02090.t1
MQYMAASCSSLSSLPACLVRKNSYNSTYFCVIIFVPTSNLAPRPAPSLFTSQGFVFQGQRMCRYSAGNCVSVLCTPLWRPLRHKGEPVQDPSRCRCGILMRLRDIQLTKSSERLINVAGRLILQYRARLRQATGAATGSAHTANLSGRLSGRSNRRWKAFTAPGVTNINNIDIITFPGPLLAPST